MIEVDTAMNATPSANDSDNLGQDIQDWKKREDVVHSVSLFVFYVLLHSLLDASLKMVVLVVMLLDHFETITMQIIVERHPYLDKLQVLLRNLGLFVQ
jgi:hypothetical protein